MTDTPPTLARAWFILIVVLSIVGATFFIALRQRARNSADTTAASALSAPDARDLPSRIASIRTRPHVYYRSFRPGEFGHVVMASLDDVEGERVVTDLQCDRVDFGLRRGICLSARPSPTGPAAEAGIYDAAFTKLVGVPLAGIPIRARLSPDERVAAVTVFVTGERYDADFTTRTTLIDTETLAVITDLEQFEAQRDGKRFSRVDFNYWGVTFARDSGHFFATLGYTGTRFLVDADLSRRQLRVVRDGVECPSLSPDETRIAFKSRVPDSTEWRPHVLDLATGREWAVQGETRSIDDQIEWLDPDHVLYQFSDTRGLPEDSMNVWKATVQPNSTDAPERLIRGANSPAIVRP